MPFEHDIVIWSLRPAFCSGARGDCRIWYFSTAKRPFIRHDEHGFNQVEENDEREMSQEAGGKKRVGLLAPL